MSSWTILLSLSCSTFNAMERLSRNLKMSLSSFCKVLCQKGYMARRPATVTTLLIPFEVALLNFWHSPCSLWISLLQFLMDVSMSLIKLLPSTWNLRSDKVFFRDFKIMRRQLSFSIVPTSLKFWSLYEVQKSTSECVTWIPNEIKPATLPAIKTRSLKFRLLL